MGRIANPYPKVFISVPLETNQKFELKKSRIIYESFHFKDARRKRFAAVCLNKFKFYETNIQNEPPAMSFCTLAGSVCPVSLFHVCNIGRENSPTPLHVVNRPPKRAACAGFSTKTPERKQMVTIAETHYNSPRPQLPCFAVYNVCVCV